MSEIDRWIVRGRKFTGKEHSVEGELSGRDVADLPVWGYTLEDPISA